MATETLLRVDNVSKRFGGVTAIDRVSFDVRQGQVIGLIGANGAGKTTLFRLIAANILPSAGTIHFDGERVDGLPPYEVSRRGIARTFQVVRPFRNLSVLENVTLGALFGASQQRSTTSAEAEARAILIEFGLGDRMDKPASELTLACLKRLEIARAVATKPRLLMLDEVFAGLTPVEIDEATAVIRSLWEGRKLTIILVEHVLKVVMRLCERVVVLHHGSKIADGSPEEVTRNPVVTNAYLGADSREVTP